MTERLVRPYAVTGGRSRGSSEDLPLETLVTTTAAGSARLPELRFERAEVVRLCAGFQSLAEIGALLGVPVGTARTLVCDLLDDGFVQVTRPDRRADGPGADVLGKVLDGLLRI